MHLYIHRNTARWDRGGGLKIIQLKFSSSSTFEKSFIEYSSNFEQELFKMTNNCKIENIIILNISEGNDDKTLDHINSVKALKHLVDIIYIYK